VVRNSVTTRDPQSTATYYKATTSIRQEVFEQKFTGLEKIAVGGSMSGDNVFGLQRLRRILQGDSTPTET
jgi:hypothetical protein